MEKIIEDFFKLFIDDFKIELIEEKRMVGGKEVGSIWSVMVDVPKDKKAILIGKQGHEAKILTLMLRHILKLRSEKQNVIVFIRP
jgi:transcription antitermination factor NusA-like protein